MRAVLTLDVGGTSIKLGAFSPAGESLISPASFPSKSKAGREELLDNFASILRQGAQMAGGAVEDIRMAFPGPFDYARGVSQMQGLDKYDALYGVSLPQALGARLAGDALFSPPLSFRFCNDIHAFALGAMVFAPALRRGRALYVCLGTGCGSAFSDAGRMDDDPLAGRCPHGWIYGLPYGDGIVDDALSVRGLRQLAETEPALPKDGLGLSQAAQAGDAGARRVFSQFGARLAEILPPLLEEYGAAHLVLGGNLTRSFEWFGAPLQRYCDANGVALQTCFDTSGWAMRGLLALP